MDPKFDLLKSLCLALYPRRLLMDFTLAWRSLSAFLIIFLTFSVLMVVFNLMLTGISPLLTHLSVKILCFCSCSPLSEAFPSPSVDAEFPSHILLVQFCVDFLFCCIIKQLVDSLGQNIGCWRQAFIQPTAGLHLVWGRTEILHLIWVLRGSMCMLRNCEKLHGGVGLA